MHKIFNSTQLIFISQKTVFLILNSKQKFALQAGHIFISNIKAITEGAPFNLDPSTQQPLFAPLAIALFHAGRHGSFLPIAIQLTPNDPESVFSTKDSKDDWLLAKMYFQSAKTSVHQV